METPRHKFLQIAQVLFTDLHQMYEFPRGGLYVVRDLCIPGLSQLIDMYDVWQEDHGLSDVTLTAYSRVP